MVVSLQKQSQRERRKREQESKHQPPKSSVDPALPTNTHKQFISVKSISKFIDLTEATKQEINLANTFIETNQDDLQESNEIIRQVVENILDSDDEEECDMTVVSKPWPISTSKVAYPAVQNYKRKDSSGEITKGYRKPIENPTSKRQKLLPAPVPKQTKHNRPLKQKKAVGGNTNMMSNWVSVIPRPLLFAAHLGPIWAPSSSAHIAIWVLYLAPICSRRDVGAII
ncbi:hypothetical protein DFH28DRAFT_929087 [Melampsora americana]|nr:hypothetical protein DFH28DRAFT_929087 [Melampsora americana]